MARIPLVTRDLVKEELRQVFDDISSRPGGVGTGPMSILKYSPEMARRARPLFDYVRNESSLPSKIRELAMIFAARAMDCPYIWHAHAGFARQEGLSDALVDALRDKQPLPAASPDETAVIANATQLFNTKRVDTDTFQAVLDNFGAQGLTELTTLLGYYTMLAFNANAVELDLPEDHTEPALPV